MDLKEPVLNALRTVEDPDLKQDLVTLNMVRDLIIDEAGNVSVTICLTTPACPVKELLKEQCERAIRTVEGVGDVAVRMTAEVRQARPEAGRLPVDGVKNIIAVGSGKGGVGKSTTSVNLAIALARLGAKVAVLDADIYGPNIPAMLGVSAKPRVLDGRIIPLQAHGVACMSMGFMVREDEPLVWRGPMLDGVVKQLLHDVNWHFHGIMDYLIVDLPPGTGDVQLSLSQRVPLTGAVIVTTPQNVALQDARKAAAMFQKVNVPILGVVENMSYYLCPKCGHRDEIFDTNGGENAARRFGVPFFGRIPLNTSIREGMDVGRPVAADPESPFYEIYRDVAQKLAQQVSIRSAGGGNPFALRQ